MSEENSNIFDHASRILGKKKSHKKKRPVDAGTAGSFAAKKKSDPFPKEEKPLEEEKLFPVPEVDKTTVEHFTKLFNDPELGKRFAVAEAQSKQLDDVASATYELLGVNEAEALDTLKDPKMAKDLRHDLIERAKELEQELFKGRIKNVRRKLLAKRLIKKSKRLRRKGLGGRKGWISMR